MRNPRHGHVHNTLPITIIALTIIVILGNTTSIKAWGEDGHYIVCAIAHANLTSNALKVVQSLLPRYAGGRIANLCSWANEIRLLDEYDWSHPLHFIETPDHLCNYNYARDCQSQDGDPHMCLSGAINNYTTQLAAYVSSKQKYNLTEALLFLAHFIGDIHQPLHLGFYKDSRANDINLQWYDEDKSLHNVWDEGIINGVKAEHYAQSNILELIKDLQENITGYWEEEIASWWECPNNEIVCPNVYAKESVKLACWWGYKGVNKGSMLEGKYYRSRLAIVQRRLGQAGIRLASILNKLFT